MKLAHALKQLGHHLNNKRSFNEQTNNQISKATKGIGLLRKLQPILSRKSLLTIYKFFITPQIDYGDHLSIAFFSNKIESVQHNAALAMKGVIKGSSCGALSWVLSISTKEYGCGDCACSRNSVQPSNYHILITHFIKWEILVETDTSKILSFRHWWME